MKKNQNQTALPTMTTARAIFADLNECIDMIEQRNRSRLKAISWRATGTLDTVVISFLVTEIPPNTTSGLRYHTGK